MAPPTKSKRAAGAHRGSGSGDAAVTDPRFAHMATDPRFRLPSKRARRVALDARFERLLHDDEFRSQASVDRYGRQLDARRRGRALERFYRAADEEGAAGRKKEGARGTEREVAGASASEEEESGEEDEVVRRELRRAGGYDPAREGGFSTSESESESESGSDAEEEVQEVDAMEGVDLEEQELGQGGEEVEEGEVTRRLAVVNLDWDNIRAVDLLAVSKSFIPADGTVEKVTVFPSEFGKERMEQEEIEGPPREIFRQGKRSAHPESTSTSNPSKSSKSNKSSKDKKPRNPEFSESDPESEPEDSDSEEEDERIKGQLLSEENAEDFNPTALRQYQLSRLRYFYAVITLSSVEAAHTLYTEMDGREYLSSANFFDLRFVPDDTDFDDKPRDEATEVPSGYKPNEFVTDALTRSKVRLTWDEDDAERKEVQRRAFARGEEEAADLAAYIGSSSSESEGEEVADEGDAAKAAHHQKGAKAARLRAMLGLGGDVDAPASKKAGQPSGEMTVTWTTGDTGPPAEEAPKHESTRDAYIRKERERKAKRKERIEALKAAETGAASGSDSEGGVPITNSKSNPEAGGEDDPFDDPFFTQDPETAEKEARKAAKAQKARKRTEQAKAEEVAKAERSRLELLLDDEEERGKHFDMAAIEKAQKQARRKGKKRRKAQDGDEAAAGDGFEVNVQDPRFAKLYTSHEFAIDPTNPRYKATDGMKALLEEGRRKRKDRGVERDPDGGAVGRTKKRKEDQGDDVARLVARLKARQGKK